MTRPTERATVAMRKCGGISKLCYKLPYAETQFVRICRIWVPEMPSEDVLVTSIQRGEASNGDNLLRRPVALVFLNDVLGWFDWMLSERSEGLVLGFDLNQAKLELRDMVPRVEVEQTLPLDWPARHADEAYYSWLDKNPGKSHQQWLEYLAARADGRLITCRISDCEEPMVPGTCWCQGHQHMR